MPGQWSTILSPAQLEADHALTMRLDPRHAIESRKFWESRTVIQLEILKSGAWMANDPDTYQKARSYLALAGVSY